MFANVPILQKIPLFWAIIPVYFVIIEVTFSMNYYIIFDPRISSFFKLISLVFFEPLALMTIITHVKSMCTSPGYVPIPFKSHYISNKLPQIRNLEKKDRDDLYCKKCRFVCFNCCKDIGRKILSKCKIPNYQKENPHFCFLIKQKQGFLKRKLSTVHCQF